MTAAWHPAHAQSPEEGTGRGAGEGGWVLAERDGGCPLESEWRVHQTPGSSFQAREPGRLQGGVGGETALVTRGGIVKGSSLWPVRMMEYCSALKGNEF